MNDFFETTIKNFSGLSSETKPTIAAGTDVPNGSRWREVDTNDLYFFNLSDDTWYKSGPDIIIYEDDRSTRVIPGSDEVFRVTMNLQNMAASTACMIIDLSDTVNWPHSNTGHIDILNYSLNLNPSGTPAFLGDFSLGFLSNVDATNGDFHDIQTWHMQKGANNISEHYDFAMVHYSMELSKWFGPVTVDDTTFQTDVDLPGPDGLTAYPSGDGDLVLKVIMSAGTVDISITVAYKVAT